MRFNSKKPAQRQPHLQGDKNRSYTYRSRRDDEIEQPKRRDSGENKGKLADFFRSATFVIGLLLFLAFLVYATALGTDAKLRFKGDQVALKPAEQYENKADELLGQSLNNRWKLSINRSDIAEALKQSFPELSFVSVSTPPWSYQPIINITVSEPSILLINGGSKYLVDNSGVAMINLDDSKDYMPDKLPQVTDETGYIVEEGRYILSSEQVGFIKEVIYQTNQKKLTAADIRLKPGGEEVHFEFKEVDYTVKFSFDNDARKSAGAFLALRKHLDEEGPLPSQYIDARVPERAYVR